MNLDNILNFVKKGINRVKANLNPNTYSPGITNQWSNSLSNLFTPKQDTFGNRTGFGTIGHPTYTDSGQLVNASNSTSNSFTGNKEFDRFIAPLNSDQSESNLRRLGRNLIITNPKNAVQGAIFGVGATTAGSVISRQGLPSMQEINAGATAGVDNSWTYPITNTIMDKALSSAARTFPSVAKFVAPLLDQNLAKAQQGLATVAEQGIKKLIPEAVKFAGKTTIREMLESPLETAAFSAMDSVDENRQFGDVYKERFLPDLGGNAMFGGIKGLAQTAIPVGTSVKTDFMNLQNKLAADKGITLNQQLQQGKIGFGDKVETPQVEGVTDPKLAQLASDPYEVVDILQNKYNLTSDEAEIIYNKINPEGKPLVDPVKLEKDFIELDKIYGEMAKIKQEQEPSLDEVLGVKPEPKPSVMNTQPEEDKGYIDSLMTEQKPKTSSNWVEDMLNKGKENKAATVETVKTNERTDYQYKPETSKKTIDDLGESATRIETGEDIAKNLTNVRQYLSSLEAEAKKRGYTWEQVVDQHSSGKVDAKIQDISDAIKAFYDKGYYVGYVRQGNAPKLRKNYWHQVNEEMLDKSDSKDFGSVLFGDAYTKQRTGKLEEQGFIKDTRAMEQYWKEIIGSAGDTDAKIKLANQIKDEVNSKIVSETEDGIKIDQGKVKIPQVNYKELAQNSVYSKGDKVVYSKKNKEGLMAKNFLSIDERVAKYGGDKVYDDFLDPFKSASAETTQYVARLNKMTDAELLEMSGDKSGRKLTKNERIDIINRQAFAEYKYRMGLAAETYMRNFANADFKSPEMESLVNEIGNEYISKDIQMQTAAKKIMAQVRAFVGRGALYGNIASSINNLFEGKRIFAAVSTKSFSKGFTRFAKGEGDAALKQYGIDSEKSTALNREQKGFWEKMDKVGYFLFDKSEKAKDGLMVLALEEQGKEKGLEGDALRKFVQKKFTQYGIKYGKGQDIGIFRNDVTKTLLQFSQYKIKDLAILVDKVEGASKGDAGDRDYLLKYTAVSVIQAAMLKQLIGMTGFGGQTGTPLDFINEIFQGKAVNSPLVNLVASWYAYSEADKNDNEYAKEKAKGEAIRTLTTAIPWSNQLYWKTGRYMMDMKRGYMETSGGNVANETSDDLWSNIKGLTLGRSYDPKRQEYGRAYAAGEEPYLSKAQTAAYKDLPEDKKTNYYETKKQADVNKKEIALFKKENDKEEKEGFLSGLFGKKEKEDMVIELPGADATYDEVKETKDKLYEKINEGLPMTDEEIRWMEFRQVDRLSGKTPSDKFEKEIKTYDEVNRVMNNETYPQEYKDRVIKLAGITKEDAEYYNKASDDYTLKAMRLEEELSTMPREEWLQKLILNRRMVGKKQISDKGTVDELYERGVLSDDERDYINAIKFDPATKNFYIDRDYKGGGSGSGGLSNTDISKIQNAFEAVNNSIAKMSARKSSIKGVTLSNQVTSANNKLISEILASKATVFKPKF